jgi:D-glycero-D-manno-heptose 1,7-bisphosphate phosphatase
LTNYSESKLKPALFLDRDGTIIKLIPYLHHPQQVKLIPGAQQALLKLNQAGYWVIITTNQSGIGRGFYTEQHLNQVNQEMINQLKPAQVDAIYHAPSAPEDNSNFRKPGIGMINAAQIYFKIDMQRSWVIGDNLIDLEFAKNAQLPFILVMTGYGKKYKDQADQCTENILQAVNSILDHA